VALKAGSSGNLGEVGEKIGKDHRAVRFDQDLALQMLRPDRALRDRAAW
jgi:hypothetical protein